MFVSNKSHPIHRWISWIAGFSWEFAGDAIDRYITSTGRETALVLDPFAGVGTTLIEAQRRGVASVGFEINPFPYLAAKAKLEAAVVDLDRFRAQIRHYVQTLGPIENAVDVRGVAAAATPRRVPPPGFRSRVPFFSPKVERKVLLSLDYIDALEPGPISDLFRLAFATTMVSFSNYTYEPSLSSRPGAGRPLQENATVVPIIAEKLAQMADDIAVYEAELDVLGRKALFDVHLGSFFDGAMRLHDGTVDLVVTSPPYLNNYHYVRNTRPHLFWLGYVSKSQDLWHYEHGSFGKYWQTVRDAEPIRLAFEMPGLARQIEELRQLNPHKGVYGGAGWANYAATYFNDSHRFIQELRRLLRPGGIAVVVVGNNILQGVEFKVDEELVRIAEVLDLRGHSEIVRTQRVGTSTIGTGLREKLTQRIELYEAAVVVQKP